MNNTDIADITDMRRQYPLHYIKRGLSHEDRPPDRHYHNFTPKR